MRRHRRILGWLHIFLGAVDLLLALVLLGVLGGLALLVGIAEPFLAGPLIGSFAVVAGIFVALTAVPNLVAGVGLLKNAGWGRVLALVLALLNVLKFPWGTALAAYTVWALSGE